MNEDRLISLVFLLLLILLNFLAVVLCVGLVTTAPWWISAPVVALGGAIVLVSDIGLGRNLIGAIRYGDVLWDEPRYAKRLRND